MRWLWRGRRPLKTLEKAKHCANAPRVKTQKRTDHSFSLDPCNTDCAERMTPETNLRTVVGIICITAGLLRSIWSIFVNKSADNTVGFSWLGLQSLGLTMMVYALDGGQGFSVPLLFSVGLSFILIIEKFFVVKSKLATPQKTATEIQRHIPTELVLDKGNYRGYHVFLDFVDVIDKDTEGMAQWIINCMLAACKDYKVTVVHHYIEIFPENFTSPPGFASVVLVDESHVTAHSYSSIGLFALDVFTCGSKPEVTQLIAQRLKENILERYPQAKGRLGQVARFPKRIVDEGSNFVPFNRKQNIKLDESL